jgi:hypothetical protein
VAVESLKHSASLPATLEGLRRRLAPGGRLVIVEDLHLGSERGAAARALMRYWSLASLFREADYVAVLGAEACEIVDFSARVAPASTARAVAKLALLEAWIRVAPRSRREALRAFAGGLHLERLYARGEMAYKAIVCPATSARGVR